MKHLVELHGGNVKAESQGEGQGAKFTVTLPLRPENVSPSVIWIDQKGNLQEKSTVGSALSGVRILTVDDHSNTLKLLSTIFSKVDGENDFLQFGARRITGVERIFAGCGDLRHSNAK